MNFNEKFSFEYLDNDEIDLEYISIIKFYNFSLKDFLEEHYENNVIGNEFVFVTKMMDDLFNVAIENDSFLNKKELKLLEYCETRWITLKSLLNMANNQSKEILHDRSEDDEYREPIGLGKLNLNQRIVLLNELGIIDFIKEKYKKNNISENGLSKIIASFLDVKHSSVSPALRGLKSEYIDSNKNPYFSEKSVNMVKVLLIKEGFTVK